MLPRLVWTIPVVLLHYGSLGTAQQRARALRRTGWAHGHEPIAHYRSFRYVSWRLTLTSLFGWEAVSQADMAALKAWLEMRY